MRKKNYYSESLKLFWKNKLAVLSLLILVILTVSAILDRLSLHMTRISRYWQTSCCFQALSICLVPMNLAVIF